MAAEDSRWKNTCHPGFWREAVEDFLAESPCIDFVVYAKGFGFNVFITSFA
jgi:hypothetical protein